MSRWATGVEGSSDGEAGNPRNWRQEPFPSNIRSPAYLLNPRKRSIGPCLIGKDREITNKGVTCYV